MRAADDLLTAACYWLERHRRITCAVICAMPFIVAFLDGPVS